MRRPETQKHQLRFLQSSHSERAPILLAEFDFKDARCRYFHDGSNLPAQQVLLRDVLGYGNDIQKVGRIVHCPKMLSKIATEALYLAYQQQAAAETETLGGSDASNSSRYRNHR
jgi:hypothetical protein